MLGLVKESEIRYSLLPISSQVSHLLRIVSWLWKSNVVWHMCSGLGGGVELLGFFVLKFPVKEEMIFIRVFQNFLFYLFTDLILFKDTL